MGTSGITDTILHFMGYLHLSETMARSEALFDGRFRKTGDDDPAGHRNEQPQRMEQLEDLPGRAVAFRDVLDQNGPEAAKAAAQFLPGAGLGARSAATIGAPFQAPQLVETSAGGFSRSITVSYKDGGTAGNVLIDQFNAMQDIDLVTTDMLTNSDGSNYIPQTFDLMPLQARMVLEAQETVPADLRLGSAQTTESVLAGVMARDADWIETGTPAWRTADTAGQIVPLQNGRYVDGTASSEDVRKVDAIQVTPWRFDDADTSMSTPKIPTLSSDQGTVVQTMAGNGLSNGDGDIETYQTSTITGPSEPETVIIEAGQNIQTNAAIIRDMNDMGRSMIVDGDYVFSQGIVQVNILTDSDHVDIATSGIGMPAVLSAGNEVHNIAEFRHESFNTNANGATATASWQVDVFKADFYDVKAIYQFNNMIDGDTVVQATSGIFSAFQTGQNEQTNLMQMSGLESYDLIIINGNYHRANWIYQYNIVLDVDVVSMLSAGDADGSTRVTTGFNGLTNDAIIATYDSDAFKPMNGSHTQLMDALANGDTILAPNPDWQLSGSATGTLRVLYVDGDYYDVNVITQVNMLYDVDHLVQASNSTEASQGVAGGGNTALNEARIVDPGILSASKYLGGDAYEASVLIQTNIVTDSDTVIIHDTQTMIPEFVAFAQADTEQQDCDSVPRPCADTALQHDNFGNILT